jgi:hypothetical protein
LKVCCAKRRFNPHPARRVLSTDVEKLKRAKRALFQSASDARKKGRGAIFMHIEKYRITRHAAQRMAQRNLDLGDLAFVLRFGRCEHRAGAKFYFLAARDLPPGSEREWSRLVGTTVVIEDERFITTVYRHKNALHQIKCKAKRNLRRWFPANNCEATAVFRKGERRPLAANIRREVGAS